MLCQISQKVKFTIFNNRGTKNAIKPFEIVDYLSY